MILEGELCFKIQILEDFKPNEKIRSKEYPVVLFDGLLWKVWRMGGKPWFTWQFHKSAIWFWL